MGELFCVLATLVLLLVNPTAAISCYSCANDFIVWHWRHFFLKRNYGLTASDESCVRADYSPDETQPCPSTCFILYLNGTNRYNGKISVLEVQRVIFQFDITEHWCFCASDECNQQSCFNRRADDYSGSPHKRRHYTFDNYWLTNDAVLSCTAPMIICILCICLIREFFCV